MPLALKTLCFKWRLLFGVLPRGLLLVGPQAGLHQLQWDVWRFDSMTSTLFAAATLLLAFMLSVPLRDDQASLYMPTDLANALAAIADTNQLVAQAHSNYDAAPLGQRLVLTYPPPLSLARNASGDRAC